MTGDEYIKGMFEDVSLFEKAWENKTCEKYIITSNEGKEYPIHLGGIMDWHDKTMGDFVKEIDKQYQSNYFVSDNGTSTTGVVG